MSQVKAIIFDWDGVLLDSREFIFLAIKDTLSAHGIEITRDEVGAVTGKPVNAIYKLLAPDLDPDLLEANHLAHHDKNLHLLSLYPGTEETLSALKQEGIKLGIFTGFNQLIHKRITQMKLENIFDSIADSSKYTAHKPDPEGLLLALDELNLNSKEAIYIGDVVIDIEAGKSAGVLATVGTTYGFGKKADLSAAGADYIIDNLNELLVIVSNLEKGNGS